MKSSTKKWNDIIDRSSAVKANSVTSDFIDAQSALINPVNFMFKIKSLISKKCPIKDKINSIVSLIRLDMRADICSCFIKTSGGFLDLYTAAGLAPDLLDKKRRLSFGEGIIGKVAVKAMAINISDTSIDDNFISQSVIGKFDYKAFCGVPILYGGTVLGVLSLQNRIKRNYSPEIIDVIQNVAMVLAELIYYNRIVNFKKFNRNINYGEKNTYIDGISFSKGLAVGNIVLHEPRLTMRNIIAKDTKAQKARLHIEIENMHNSINHMINNDEFISISETRDILETYKMFAYDRGWLAKIESAIDKGLSAEAAVQKVLNEIHVRMSKIEDNYIRDKLSDIEDVSNRLLSHLMKQYRIKLNAALPDNIILVAKSLSPAALLDYDRDKLKGVVLEKGTSSNHLAIVARSMGIPVIGQCGDILNYTNFDDPVVIDTSKGKVYLRPSQYITDYYSKKIRKLKADINNNIVKNNKAVTKDGKNIDINMNAGLLSDLSYINTAGVDGIGLFRTEILFMGLKKYPMVDEQIKLYKNIFDRAGDRPVIFRTLDIGGDKPLSYFKVPEEENPALGWRAVRIGIDRPVVLRTQFRALIASASGHNLKIMLPFVTEVSEFDEAKKLLEMEKSRARRNNIEMPNKIEMGVMLEIPSLIWQLDVLLKKVDFISVGTNDLMQYLYAADRNNEVLRDRYDSLSPAMLLALKTIADKCNVANIPLSLCGEMAGKPLETMVLIALGYSNFSVSRQSVDVVKLMISSLETKPLMLYLKRLMASGEHSLRERLISFARDHKINIKTAA